RSERFPVEGDEVLLGSGIADLRGGPVVAGEPLGTVREAAAVEQAANLRGWRPVPDLVLRGGGASQNSRCPKDNHPEPVIPRHAFLFRLSWRPSLGPASPGGQEADCCRNTTERRQLDTNTPHCVALGRTLHLFNVPVGRR